MTKSVCRWGILSAAIIAKKNWLAIRNSGNGVVAAVAARSLDKAKDFIHECQGHSPFETAPDAVEGYDALLARKDIDAVYIPVPTGLRKEWVIRAAEAGKHVLAEKPVGCNAADVAAMIDACRRNNVQFMDGVMYMHGQRLKKLREVLDDGTSVGKIRRIASQFSFNANDEFKQSNIRSSGELEPLGCLGDLGWYTIRFALWVMNYRMPIRVSGRMLSEHRRPDSKQSVPMEFSAELFFPDGVSATFYNSFQTENQQWVNVSGTKGFVHMRDFVLPFFGNESSFTVTNAAFRQVACDFGMEDHTRRVAVAEYSNSTPCSQEANLFRNFATLALSGKPDPHWGDIALKTQQVMDACLTSARQDGAFVAMG